MLVNSSRVENHYNGLLASLEHLEISLLNVFLDFLISAAHHWLFNEFYIEKDTGICFIYMLTSFN